MKFSLIHLPTFYPEVHHSDAQFYPYILEQSDRAELPDALCPICD